MQLDQTTLNFMQSQTTHVEAGIYRKKYPQILYPQLIPIDRSAAAWAKTVTFYAVDGTGEAEFISGKGGDIPLVGVDMQQYQTPVKMASIGYGWSMEEIEQAKMAGVNLGMEKGHYARKAYEEMVDSLLLAGKAPSGSPVASAGFNGLINYPGITTAVVPNGAAASPLLEQKTDEEILLDINNIIVGAWIDSKQVMTCDTLLLPPTVFAGLLSRKIANTTTTLFEHIMRTNIYTMMTKKELTILAIPDLETAGAGATRRMVAYVYDDTVLKAHIPMPLRFLPPQVKGLNYIIPGIFRLGGLDIRSETGIRYTDGI